MRDDNCSTTSALKYENYRFTNNTRNSQKGVTISNTGIKRLRHLSGMRDTINVPF